MTEETIPVGTRLELLFSVPEGEIRALAVVRSCTPGRGIGVEFVALESGAFDSVLKLGEASARVNDTRLHCIPNY